MSKGSTPRPLSVSVDEYGAKHDRIFGRVRKLTSTRLTEEEKQRYARAPGLILWSQAVEDDFEHHEEHGFPTAAHCLSWGDPAPHEGCHCWVCSHWRRGDRIACVCDHCEPPEGEIGIGDGSRGRLGDLPHTTPRLSMRGRDAMSKGSTPLSGSLHVVENESTPKDEFHLVNSDGIGIGYNETTGDFFPVCYQIRPPPDSEPLGFGNAVG